MSVNRPATVTRNQLNIKELRAEPRQLLNTVKNLLEGWDYDADDTKYKYKGSDESVEQVQFIIHAEKDVDYYTRFIITIEVTIEDAVLKKFKKGNVIKGEGKVILKSELLFDYDDTWSKDPILHFLKNVYEKYVYFNTMKEHETKIAKEMFNLRDTIKEYVQMK